MEKQQISVADIIKSREFYLEVDTMLKDLKDKKNKRPLPPTGVEYRKDWVDRFMTRGILKAPHFVNNIRSIWEKTSKLPSQDRQIISMVCQVALDKHISKLSKDKK